MYLAGYRSVVQGVPLLLSDVCVRVCVCVCVWGVVSCGCVCVCVCMKHDDVDE